MTALTRMPRTQLLVAISVVILVALLFANVAFQDEGEEGSVASWLGTSVFAIAVAAVLVLVVVPKLRGDQRKTAVLGFGIGALVTVVIFWSGLPFALAAAALAAAGPSDDAVEGEAPAPSSAGVILAVLAIAAAFVFCVIG